MSIVAKKIHGRFHGRIFDPGAAVVSSGNYQPKQIEFLWEDGDPSRPSAEWRQHLGVRKKRWFWQKR